MSDVEKLHEDGLNLTKMLEFIGDELGNIIDGEKVTDAIERYRYEIKDELSLCSHYRVTSQDRSQSKKLIEDKKKIIAELEDKLLDALYDCMKKGRYIAVAYNNRNNSCPVIIARREWDEIQIDIERNSAYGDMREYSGIRFVTIEQLGQLTTNEFKVKLPLETSHKIDIQPVKEKKKESKVKLETLEKQADSKPSRKRQDNLTKAIKAAIQQIGKKPSMEELWQYFQDDKDETGTIVDYKDSHITWKTTKGEFKDIKKETLANRLSRIKP